MLSSLSEAVRAAQERAARVRPPVEGFPHLAECLRQAGIDHVHCVVPSMTTVYVAGRDSVVEQGPPLVSGLAAVERFDADALVTALRRDQRGETSYAEFLAGTWRAGVVTYDIDLAARSCTYHAATGEHYVEQYRAVTLAG